MSHPSYSRVARDGVPLEHRYVNLPPNTKANGHPITCQCLEDCDPWAHYERFVAEQRAKYAARGGV